MAASERHVTDPNATYGGLFQLSGDTTANVAQAEATTRAVRATLRAPDLKFRGAFRSATNTGEISAANFDGIRFFSAIWQYEAACAIIRRVGIGYEIGARTTPVAGICGFRLTRNSAYTTAPGGTKTMVSPGGQNTRLRSAMGESQLLVYQATAATGLTSPTQTADTNSIGTVYSSVPATANVIPIPANTSLFEAAAGEPPLVLMKNQGIDVICVITPHDAAQTGVVSVTLVWEEYNQTFDANGI